MGYRIRMLSGEDSSCRSLSDFFRLTDERKEIISFVGGGGKTTMLLRLAGELSGRKKDGSRRKILLSTTTKMWMPETGCVLLSPSSAQIEEALLEEPYVVLGRSCPPKLEGVEADLLLKAEALADIVLLEADGAKGKPLKAPAPYEPVIRPETTKVAAVVGLSGLLKPVEEACHRPGLVLSCLGEKPGHIMTCEDIAALAVSEEGLKKAVKGREYYILLNQAEGELRQKQAETIAGLLLEKVDICGVAAVWQEGEELNENMGEGSRGPGYRH